MIIWLKVENMMLKRFTKDLGFSWKTLSITYAFLAFGSLFTAPCYAALSPATIQHILHQCADGTEEYALTSLSGGYSGSSLYKIKTPGPTLVVRQLPNQTSSKEMERLAELSTLAGNTGSSPKVCGTVPEEKIIVTEFIEGNTTDPLNLSHKDLAQLAHILKQFHHAALPPHETDPIRRLEGYLSQVPPTKRPTAFQEVLEFLHLFCSLRDQHQQKGFTHTDLHAMNVLHHGQNFWIIDMEDSGAGDIYFDLGQFIKNFLLDETQQSVFLNAYLDHPTSDQMDYIYLNTQVAHVLYAAWGLLNGLEAIESTAQLDQMLNHICDVKCNEFLKDVHSGHYPLQTPKDKIRYGLINLHLFLEQWRSGKIQAAAHELSALS